MKRKRRLYNFNFPEEVSRKLELLVQESGLNRTSYLITLIAKEAKELNITPEIKSPKENSL